MSSEFFQASVIDRLCGSESAVSLGEIRESVRSDLESLLNSQQGRNDIPEYFEEVQNSIATYGLNNFNSINLEAFDERQKLLRSIKRTIELFEPRLEKVDISDKEIIHPFILQFQINAVLRVGKYVDHIVFGTTIKKNGTAIVES